MKFKRNLITFSLALNVCFLSVCCSALAEGFEDKLKENTDTIAEALVDIAPKGWVADKEVERYIVDNLYDKINGRSELYMSYDFVGMTFVTIVPEDESDKTTYVDIFLYDQLNAENAYGVYGVERWPGNPHLKIGRDAYRADADLFLWHGQYYVTLLGSGDDPKVHAAAEEMAKKLVKRLKDDPKQQLWGFSLMPEEKRKEDTLQFFKVDAMSLDFMTDTYTADYTFGEEEIRFFLSRQASEDKAKEVLGKYTNMLEQYGDGLGHSGETLPSISYADMGGGYFDVIFQYKHFVGGVTAVSNLELAKKATQELFFSIQKKLDKDKIK